MTSRLCLGHWSVGYLLRDGRREPGEHDLQHFSRVDEALQQRHRLRGTGSYKIIIKTITKRLDLVA